MYTTIRDAFYGHRAGSVVKAVCLKHDCGWKAIGNYAEKPLGTIYTQLTIATPNMMAMSYEITGDLVNIDSVALELHNKGVFFSNGKVQVTTEGKFSTVVMANSFACKNYMIT